MRFVSSRFARRPPLHVRSSIHAGMGERTLITFHLRLSFGDTFAEGAYFYKKPNAKKFVACLLHVASGGRVSKHADTSRLFVKNIGKNTYRVDEAEMNRLGCTMADLYETLRRTPGAKAKYRHPKAAPLNVPAPDDLGDDDLPFARPGRARCAAGYLRRELLLPDIFDFAEQQFDAGAIPRQRGGG